jgi:hypothetical protein
MNIVPSIELIPAKYGVGTLLTQVPMDVSGDFSVTRATAVSTRYNSAGLIETIASGIPRLDYYTSSGTPGCPALLVEPSAANGILNSQDTATNWQLGLNLSSGYVDVIGVSGNNLSVEVSGNSVGGTNGSLARLMSIPLASGSTYTISFLVKKTGTHTIAGYYANAGGDLGGGFDISGSFSNGSLYNNGNVTNRIRRVEQWGTDVYRCSETFTMTASGTITAFRLAPVSGVTTKENSAVGTELAFAAPQIELGSVPTSFIPTTTGSVTRDADVINKTGVSGLIGQTQGTIYAEFRYLGNPIVRAGFVFLRQTGFRGLSINFAPSDFPSGIFFISRNNAGSTSIRLTNGLTLGAYYKIAVSYDAGGTAAGGTQASGVTAYVNGSPATVSVGDLRVPDANLNELRLYGANSGDENEVPNGNLRAAAVYKTRLPNYLLESATSQIQSYSALASSLSYTVV